MKTLDAYFSYSKGERTKFVLESKSGTYPALEEKTNKGEAVIYWCSPTHIKANKSRTPNFAINTRHGHLSGLFIPDLTKPHLAFGDVKESKDGLLFIIGDGRLEVFVSRGKADCIETLFQLLAAGDLDAEIAAHRKNAKPDESSRPSLTAVSSARASEPF
jgi:hypothetical protein